MKHVALFCLLILVQISAWGASRGLIWEIASDDKPTYLMGSVHFGKDDLYPLSDAIMKAYEASDVIYVEVDTQAIPLQEQQMLTFKYALYPDGERIQDHVSAETLNLFSQLLAKLGSNIAAFERFRPTFLMTNIALMQGLSFGYQPALGIDNFFLSRARGSKQIRQIETFEGQMQLLSELPIDDQTLKDSLRDMDEFESLWAAMMDAWKTGDGPRLYEEAIAKPLKQYPHLAPYFKKVFFDRNVKMADVASKCISNKEACFIVVGAGHLVGQDGMVNLLKQRGFKLKQR